MSGLGFRLRASPPERLDLSPLTPQRLSGLSTSEIERLPVGTSRMRLVVADVFDVSAGDVDDIRIDGSERLDLIGHGLSGGRITIEGDVGQRLGFAMAGGEICVAGSAGPFAASGATGGLVRIEGNCGASAGGAVHGAMRGLDGATLIISGEAGPRLGDRMKSGLAVVAEAGDFAGCRMIAGTIVARRIGGHAGYGMRRGTIVAGQCGDVLPSFVETGRHRLVFLNLLRPMLNELAPDWDDLLAGEVRRHAGDMATLGKGEILTPW